MSAARRIVLCATGLVFAPALAPAAERPVITALIENDSFGGADRNYTNGVKFSYTAPWRPNNRMGNRLVHMIWPNENPRFRTSWGFGQSMFTPNDITIGAPLPGQQPYAGWLYGSWGFLAQEDGQQFRPTTNFEIEVGIIGPSAGAKWVQTNFHKLINGQTPKGWDNQLKDEPGIDINLERNWELARDLDMFGLEADMRPDIAIALGNVRTEASAGLTFRLGTDLKSTELPMRVRPSLSGSGAFDATQGAGFSLFAGIYERAVVQNIFLDGNTFRDSLSVKKKPFVTDMQAGVAVRFGPPQLSFTYVWRSEEFKGQLGPAQFGAAALAWNL